MIFRMALRGLTRDGRFSLVAILAVPRIAAFVGAFSLLSLLIAVAGVHGVLEYVVARRKREIGIRLALGARPGAIVYPILRQAFLHAVVGGVGGLCAALLFRSALGSLVFGVRATDPGTAAVACLLLVGAV